MSRKMIPVEKSFATWRKDPESEKTYNALEDEFSLAAIIKARAHAGLTHERRPEGSPIDPAGLGNPALAQCAALLRPTRLHLLSGERGDHWGKGIQVRLVYRVVRNPPALSPR